ncbi:fatty acid desaturase [Bacillus alkalicellulosilyticus]|uniref:fatty acid desaturase n=1 Tax=Alkalihalobacterium alkalicellulosilyticum TaxID=1912214 RepID=UPI000998BF79|nr:fatty acid desaturase [Bacillus alkalicellulosilyticus]
MNTFNEKHLRKQTAPFEKPDNKASSWQLANTLIPFFSLWIAAYMSLSISYILTLAISIINAGFLVRVFIIFHDCCHHSFFSNRRLNKVIGNITGILTFFPYNQWQRSHSIHHATSGNLDKRGVGDIWVMTVYEYVESPKWEKIAYRLYRNPFVMFVLGPIFAFLIQQRFNKKGARRKEKLNTYFTNISIVAIIWALCVFIGWKEFLLVHGPIFIASGIAGIWLFYVQHQFEDSYFEEEGEWSYIQAAVDGSSYYKLPKILQWLTGNIGFHHVHHLNPKVPNYLLEEAHNFNEPLKHVTTITLKTSLQSLKFRLWDEELKKFISFKELKDRTIGKVENIENTSHQE